MTSPISTLGLSRSSSRSPRSSRGMGSCGSEPSRIRSPRTGHAANMLAPAAADDGRSVQTFWRYVRVQAFVFVCGIVGPIFLIVYFAAQPEPTLKWMYWAGLFVTAARRPDRAGDSPTAADRRDAQTSQLGRTRAVAGRCPDFPASRVPLTDWSREGSIPSPRCRHHVVHRWAAGAVDRTRCGGRDLGRYSTSGGSSLCKSPASNGSSPSA